MEKVGANGIKKDMILVIKDELWRVISQPSHVKPGKGPAYIQLELKNILTGTKKNERYSSSDVFDKAFIESKKVEFLFKDGDFLTVMDKETFEQMNINQIELTATELKLLEDSMELEVQLHEDKVISLKLPQHVTKQVLHAEPHIKNSAVTNSMKNATIAGGLNIRVPGFVETDHKIIIDTETLEFVKILR